MKPKLVRDNIITIIKNSGRSPVYFICTDSHQLTLFFNLKLKEELLEYEQANTSSKKEELADVWEVVECAAIKMIVLDLNVDINEMMSINNYSYSEILTIKQKKQIKNGSFLLDIILEGIN